MVPDDAARAAASNRRLKAPANKIFPAGNAPGIITETAYRLFTVNLLEKYCFNRWYKKMKRQGYSFTKNYF